jgi:pilus assembly protein CpaC
MSETLNKIPGLGDVPLLGKLFQTRALSRKNSELLVMVTPEVVRPLPSDQTPPDLNWPKKFMEPNSEHPRHPGIDKTGPVPVKSAVHDVPMEQLVEQQKQGQAAPPPSVPQFVLSPVQAAPPSLNPGLAPTAPLPAPGTRP